MRSTFQCPLPFAPFRTLFPLALVATTLAACAESSVSAPSPTEMPAAVTAALDSALLDEWHAENIYLRVIADHGNVLPFFNVVIAEQRHSATLEAVLRSRAMPIPGNPWTLENVPRFTTVAEACAAAAAAEVANVALYDRYLSLNLPADVLQVFSANRRASIQNHLPAFERCR
jgi:hypothetical protein